MKPFTDRSAAFLHAPVRMGPRGLLALAAILIVVAHFTPLWNLTMFEPQYSRGRRLDIYDHALVGGDRGQDLKEINSLNHYIGMHDLAADTFTEFKWMPFVMGALALLLLRAVVLGSFKELLDATVLFFYFGAFSLWSFASRLYSYGHDLSPTAAVKVAGFMPPMFGYKQIANFEVYSYPRLGTYLMLGVAALLLTAVWMAWRQRPRPSA